MSTAIPVHVALINQTYVLSETDLQDTAGALNEQVQADFRPVWHVNATIGANDHPPANTWQIRLQHGIDDPGALGYHTDQNNQPYAVVDVSPGDWTVTASHELLEMLADPFGNRMHTALGPVGTEHEATRVHYLVEVCDPCEATSYQAGGINVSDFLTPAYYRTSRSHKASSHVGGLGHREIAPDGYVSYQLDTGEWWQATNWGTLETHSLGTFQGGASLREWTDKHARERG